jgi:hypothetical protein
VKLPLFISRGDFSLGACQRIIALHADQAGINPNGWRKPRTTRLGARPAPGGWFQNRVLIVRIIKGLMPKMKPVEAKTFTVDPIQAAINKLTNWQRGRWQAAGRPMSVAGITPFSQLVHP